MPTARVLRRLVSAVGFFWWLGACTGASKPGRAGPEPRGALEVTEVTTAPVDDQAGEEHRRAEPWTFWSLPSQPFPPVRLLPGLGQSVTVFSVSADELNFADDPVDLERSSRESRAALERFQLMNTAPLQSSWRYPMRVGSMSAPVVASGPNGSIVVAGNWVTGLGGLDDDAGRTGIEVLSEGYLQRLDASGSVAMERKFPPLRMRSVLQHGDTSFILEQEDAVDAPALAFDVSVRVVGPKGQAERQVSLVQSGAQVAGPMLALPDGGVVVGAPFGVMTGAEQLSRFVWLSADGSVRFTREVVGITRSFGANDGLAMVVTATGSIAVAFRCLFETQLLKDGAAPITLTGTSFSKETHDLCLWHYDEQGHPRGARRVRRLGYLSVKTLVQLHNGELWLLGSVKHTLKHTMHIWRFDAAWTPLGEVPIPRDVVSISDLAVLSNGDAVALVEQKASERNQQPPERRFALTRIPIPE